MPSSGNQRGIDGPYGARSGTGKAGSRHLAARRGCSYDEIAEQLGYANRGSAWKAVDGGLRAERDVRAGDYLQTQIDRYETILATWWENATTGHEFKAADTVLRALERLDKVLQLERLDKGEHAGSSETLCISASPEAHAAQLQQVVEEREHQARATR